MASLDLDGNLLGQAEYGEDNATNFTEVRGNFSLGGRGAIIPEARRYSFSTRIRFGGAPVYDEEGNLIELSSWSGAVVLPLSVAAMIETSGSEIPEPGTLALTSLLLLLFGRIGRKPPR